MSLDHPLTASLLALVPAGREGELRSWLAARPAGEDTDTFLAALLRTELLDPEDRPAASRLRLGLQLTAPADAFQPTLPPDLHEVDGFALLGEIGRGGMGTVDVARDLTLRRKVAYKRLHVPAPSEALRAFVAEAQITAQLDHPNIIPVYRLSHDGEAPGFAMKLVGGSTLLDRLLQAAEADDDEVALRGRLELFLKICDGLAYAHAAGVVHCDLKPANVMLGDYGEVYVMDWGIARRVGDPAPDMVHGTPAYMSPEQARGEPVGPASDQYALGLLLQELVTLGRARSPASSLAKALIRAGRGHREPMTHARPGTPVPPELVAVVERATALEPGQRYPDVGALAADVHRHLQGEAVSVLPDGPWRAIVRRVSRRPGAALATALSVLLLVVVTSSAATVSSLQAAVDADRQALQVTARLGTVERRAGAIETEVLRFGRLLEGISTATTVALSQTQPEDARPWLVLDPSTAPDDLVDSAVDGAVVSLRTPVFRSAPSADPLALQPVFRRLTRLDGTLRRALLRSAPGGGVTWDLAEARRIHLSGDTPVRRLRVALTDGTELVFPGQAEAAIEDPREASWYQRSADQPFPHWEPPTLDAMGRVVVVVGRSIYAEDDPRFLGVASAEIVVDRTLAKLLAERDADLVHQWVVDGSGRVIGSDEGPGKLRPAPVDGLDELLDDHLTTWREESDGIVVTAPLPQLGWALVARYGASPRDRR